MSLIRNGGFERSNTDFWGIETDATLEIDNTNQKYGTYCGKFISSGVYSEYIIANDYITVNPSNIIQTSAWAKSSSVRKVQLVALIYDSDYSFIKRIYGIDRYMDGTYLQLNNQFVLPFDAAYIRLGYYISGSHIDEIFYIDGFNASIITAELAISGSICLHEHSVETAGGNTNDNKMDMKQFSTYYADLFVDSVSGTDPKLDVSVYEINNYGQGVLLDSFTQAIASTWERIVLTNPLGNMMYIVYTITGTSPSFAFRVDITGKR